MQHFRFPSGLSSNSNPYTIRKKCVAPPARQRHASEALCVFALARPRAYGVRTVRALRSNRRARVKPVRSVGAPSSSSSLLSRSVVLRAVAPRASAGCVLNSASAEPLLVCCVCVRVGERSAAGVRKGREKKGQEKETWPCE